MEKCKAVLGAIRALQTVCKHPHPDLLKTYIQLLDAGQQFNMALSEYENFGPDTKQRLACDTKHSLLFKMNKARSLVEQTLATVQASRKELMPENGLTEDYKDMEPAMKLLKLDPDLMITFHLDSDVMVDAVELISTNYQERLKSGVVALKQLCGELSSEEGSWHHQIPTDASVEEVLKRGRCRVRI